MITVRRATLADAERIITFNAAMARETEGLLLDPETLGRGVRQALADKVGAFYRLAEHEGAVVGQLMITQEWSDWRAAWVWWIQSVYVVPEARRLGVYRALHEAALSEARASGAAGLRLYVDSRNARAMSTYAALGMDGEHYRVFEQMFAEPPVIDTAPHPPAGPPSR